MTEFDLRALLDHDVRFVVIGGVAAGAHGFVRGTEDLDLVPDPDHLNLQRLTAALTELDSTLPTVGGNVTATTKFGALDVVQRAQGVPSYTQLTDDAVDSQLLGVPCPN